MLGSLQMKGGEWNIPPPDRLRASKSGMLTFSRTDGAVRCRLKSGRLAAQTSSSKPAVGSGKHRKANYGYQAAPAARSTAKLGWLAELGSIGLILTPLLSVTARCSFISSIQNSPDGVLWLIPHREVSATLKPLKCCSWESRDRTFRLPR